jgi:phosphoenolpyruvate synthase/pyruvate phosphate dikinase
MKFQTRFWFCLMSFCASMLLGTACKVGEGCPTKDYTAKVNRKGQLSTKHGKTGNLFGTKKTYKR